MRRRLLSPLVPVLVVLCLYQSACRDAARIEGDAPVSLRLVAEGPAPESGGSIWIGAILDLQPGWHVYWRHPGFSGQPLQVHLDLPPGVTAGPVQWPLPTRFDYPGVGVDFGYEDAVGLPVRLALPAGHPGTSYPVSARVGWVACKLSCVPGESRASFDLTVGEPPAPPQPALAAWLAQLPGEAPPGLVTTRAVWGEMASEGQRNLELELEWAGDPPEDLACFPILGPDLRVEEMETSTRGHITATRVRTISRLGSASTPEQYRLEGAVYTYASRATGQRAGFQVRFSESRPD